MVLFIALCLLCLGIYIYYAYDNGFWCFGEAALSFLLVLLGWLFSFLIVLGVSTMTTYCVADENKSYEIESSHNIVALKDNPDVTGSFFLFSGYEEEELYYYYAEETELGIKTKKVNADDVYIIYDNEPRIEEYYAKKFKHWWHYIYAFPSDYYYKIYVPDGTVTTDFEIDLE